MSTALATEPYRPQRTERLRPVDTEPYQLPATGPAVPAWAERVEETIRVTARLGYSPTPSIVLISGLIIAAALHHG